MREYGWDGADEEGLVVEGGYGILGMLPTPVYENRIYSQGSNMWQQLKKDDILILYVQLLRPKKKCPGAQLTFSEVQT